MQNYWLRKKRWKEELLSCEVRLTCVEPVSQTFWSTSKPFALSLESEFENDQFIDHLTLIKADGTALWIQWFQVSVPAGGKITIELGNMNVNGILLKDLFA